MESPFRPDGHLPYRNHEIPIFLKGGLNRALRFGISDSHTFARRCTPSNVVLCLSRGRQCYTALQTDIIIMYIHIYSRFVEPNIFTNKISIQDPRPMTVSILNHRRDRQMQLAVSG